VSDPQVVIVSNRGPLSFSYDEEGQPRPTRGAGGLVTGLSSLAGRADTTWVSAAISSADRAVAGASEGPIEAEGYRVEMLAVDSHDYAAAYDVISNQTLWFCHHRLFDLAVEPRIDDAWWGAWRSYERVNRAFADRVAQRAERGAVVLVQDYHLTLVGSMLRANRPDLRTVHFHHTPFADPATLGLLPGSVVAALLEGLAGFDACGFHSRRWVDDYLACAAAHGLPAARVFVSPLAVEPADLQRSADTQGCRRALADLEAQVGDRQAITRVDRIELSKNLLRGFAAYDLLLTREPHRRGEVVFVACCYPSREGVPAYARYRAEVERVVDDINTRWGTHDWTPVLWDTSDDYPRSLAALRRADVVVVNPIRDGLNLVAKEASIIGQRAPGVVLSSEAGVYDELGPWCDVVNPFDISETATAMATALDRGDADRSAMAQRRLEASLARTPANWLDDQLAALD